MYSYDPFSRYMHNSLRSNFTLSGFGKFHYMLLAISGLIYMDTAIGVTILSFVLPAAQCDLEMDSTSKGWLTAAPMLGMYK